MVACDGACDSGSSHGGLVMAFMSTMVLGLKRREQTRVKKTGEREQERKERKESDIIYYIIIIFNYTILLLQYHPKNRMVL